MDGGPCLLPCLSLLSAGNGAQTASSWPATRPGKVSCSKTGRLKGLATLVEWPSVLFQTTFDRIW